MPNNVPPELKDKYERCLDAVTKGGKPKQIAYAICYASVVKSKEVNLHIVAPTPTAKAITDAEGLRGEDERNCHNCRFYQALPETHLAEEIGDVAEKITAPSDMVEPASGRGICAQYEFETDVEWVCDGWESIERPVQNIPIEIKEKSLSVKVRDLLAAKIHQAFTVAADQLAQRGYVNQEERIPLSGAIGKMLDMFNQEIDNTVAERIVDGSESGEIAMKENSLVTMKQADGKYRWVLFSSSSYQDRDGEVVSQKALEDDTAQMNARGDFGTLDWWHTPIVLGDCDFSAMHGRISIESGTFRDDFVGAMLATQKGLGASRTFYNPITEPDAQGVYHNIRTISRAILPAERASNLLTRVSVIEKEKTTMFEDKIKRLKELLGGTPEASAKVDTLLATAEQTDKAAQDAGLTAKETVEPVAEPPAEQKAWFVGDMTPDEFDQRIESAVAKFLEPMTKEIGVAITNAQSAQVATMKEANDALLSQIAATNKAQAELTARLAALEGMTPRAYRASQDDATVIDAQTKKEITQPHGDAMAENTFQSWLSRNLNQAR